MSLLVHSFVRPGAYRINTYDGVPGAFPVAASEDESESFSLERDESFVFDTPSTQRLSRLERIGIPVASPVEADEEEDWSHNAVARAHSEFPVIDAIDVVVVDSSSVPQTNQRKRGLRRVFRKLSKLLHPPFLRRSSTSSKIQVASLVTTSSSNEIQVASPVTTSSSNEIQVASPVTTSSSNEIQVASPATTSSPNPWLTPSADDERLRTLTHSEYYDLRTPIVLEQEEDSIVLQEEGDSILLLEREKGDDKKADYRSTSTLITNKDSAADKKEVARREHCFEHRFEHHFKHHFEHRFEHPLSQSGACHHSMSMTPEDITCDTPLLRHNSCFADELAVHPQSSNLVCYVFRVQAISTDSSSEDDVLLHEKEDADTSSQPSASSATTIDMESTERTDGKDSLLAACKSLNADDKLELVYHLMSELGFELGEINRQEMETLQYRDSINSIVWHTLKCRDDIKLDNSLIDDCNEAVPSMRVSDRPDGRQKEPQEPQPQRQQKKVEDQSPITDITPQKQVLLEEHDGTMPMSVTLRGLISDRSFVDDDESQHGHFVPPNCLSESHEPVLRHQVRCCIVDHKKQWKTILASLLDDEDTVPDLEPLLESPPASPRYQHQGRENASTAPVNVKDASLSDLQSSVVTPILQQKKVEDESLITHNTLLEQVLEEHDGTMPIGLISDRSFVDDDESQHGHFVPPNCLSESREPVLRHQVRSCIVDHMKQWKTFFAGLLDDDDTVPDLEPLLESQLASPRYQHQGRENASTEPVNVKDSISDLRSSVVTSMPDESLGSSLITACHRCRLYTTAAQSCQMPVDELKRGVVLVGLWDATRKGIAWVGSGFVVDPRLGLVVTAAHVLFDLRQGQSFGSRFYGLTNAKVVLGVLRDESNVAVYRYCGEVIDDGVNYGVDACIVRITSQLRRDVDDEGPDCAFEPEVSLIEGPPLQSEPLCALKLAMQSEKQCFKLETQVRVIGYNQEGEGVFKPGTHLNRMVGYAGGYICDKFESKRFRNCANLTEKRMEQMAFCPREEIIATCRTMSGHSGGPCVNDEGLVIGILSRGDETRSYMVPSWELLTLLERARSYIGPRIVPREDT